MSASRQGTLYLVATPIGNLDDITARALKILHQASLIAAEDTRQARKLLGHYHIVTPVTSYHEHNKASKMPKILAALAIGDVALISDAGTPGLNDPGYELVAASLAAGHEVRPIPGPSAPIAALVVSGLPSDAFLYLGYLPRRRAERRRVLEQVAGLPYTLVFLETPHRLLESLEDMEASLGDRRMAIARELTKLYEEIFRGSISQGRVHFTRQQPRGEFTLVVAGGTPAGEAWSEERLRAAAQGLLDDGLSTARVAGQLAAESGWPRRAIYQLVVELGRT